MKELKDYRVTAEDGKNLLSIFVDFRETMPDPILEKRSVLIGKLAEEIVNYYGKRLLDVYTQDESRLKRIRTATLVCRIKENVQNQKGRWVVLYDCSFSKSGKILYTFTEQLCYEEALHCFLPDNRIK